MVMPTKDAVLDSCPQLDDSRGIEEQGPVDKTAGVVAALAPKYLTLKLNS
jgi:hypothetical protein